LAFGAAAGRRGPAEVVFLEQASGLVSLLVWIAFGMIAVPILLNGVSVTIVMYACSASPWCGCSRLLSP
jgi:hypothetical protein